MNVCAYTFAVHVVYADGLSAVYWRDIQKLWQTHFQSDGQSWIGRQRQQCSNSNTRSDSYTDTPESSTHRLWLKVTQPYPCTNRLGQRKINTTQRFCYWRKPTTRSGHLSSYPASTSDHRSGFRPTVKMLLTRLGQQAASVQSSSTLEVSVALLGIVISSIVIALHPIARLKLFQPATTP